MQSILQGESGLCGGINQRVGYWSKCVVGLVGKVRDIGNKLGNVTEGVGMDAVCGGGW